MAREEEKWERRDQKRRKARHGMQVDGKSVFLVQEVLIKKSQKKKKRGK